MIPVKHLSVAVIGDEDLVNGLRLAGIGKNYVITDSQASREEIRNALSRLLDEPEIGIIIILENYADHVTDMVTQLKERRRAIPIVLEVPSKFGSRYRDVAAYYKAYIRAFIGFDIEI